MDLESAYLIPLSDLHIGAGFNERKFRGYRDWILQRDNAFCVVLGDVTDNSISSPLAIPTALCVLTNRKTWQRKF